MIARFLRPLVAVALTAAVGLSLTACSGGTVTLSKEQVAQQISDQLNQQIGQRPDAVTCPEDLPGKVGTSVRCVIKAGNDTLGVTATVTAVEGTNVKFNIQVDPNVTPGPGTPPTT